MVLNDLNPASSILSLITSCNQRIKGIDQENKEVRRMLCKVCYNDLLTLLNADFTTSKTLGNTITALDKDIRAKEEKQKVSRKHKLFNR